MYDQSTLTNGLRIVTKHISGRDSAGLAFWVKVGGRYEQKKLSGISHFVEHMLFKGTNKRTTKQIKEEVEGVGGMLNAFTGEESTCYFVKIQKSHFKHAFDVLQDMINDATLKNIEFMKERTVILEEIKMYLDLPSQYVHEVMSELLWPEQPLGRPIAGTIQTVSDLKRKDLWDYVQTYYHPCNMLITACGEVNHSEIRDLAEKCFTSNGKKSISKFTPAYSVNSKERFRFINKKTEQTHFVIAVHGLPRNHLDRYKLAVLNVILGANMSSRLFEEVRERRGLAYEIKSGICFYEDTGAVTISAGVEPKKAPLAVRVIMRELGRMKSKAASKSEMRRAKDYFLGQLVLGLEDTLDHALWFGERVLYGNEIPNLSEIRKQVEAVTPEDVMDLAERLFKSNKIHLSLIGPFDDKFERSVRSECHV